MGMLHKLNSALLVQAEAVARTDFTAPKGSRKYVCSAAACGRPAFAKGFCNLHYIRAREGRDLNAPFRAKKHEDNCTACGKKTGAKGGWGLCSKHYKKKRYEILKSVAVETLGGCCSKCLKVFHLSVYDFHHTGAKINAPSTIFTNCSTEVIAAELSQCVLLCANCHRIEHHDKR